MSELRRVPGAESGCEQYSFLAGARKEGGRYSWKGECHCRYRAHDWRIIENTPQPHSVGTGFLPPTADRRSPIPRPLGLSVPVQSPRPSTNKALCQGSLSAWELHPLPPFDNFPLPTRPTSPGWVTASLPPPERMSHPLAL